MRLRASIIGLVAALLGSAAVFAQIEAPEIQLPPMPVDGPRLLAQPEAVETADPDAQARAEPRDQPTTEASEGAGGGLLLPLLAPAGLPETVRIGASQPEPGVLRLTGEVAQTSLTLQLPDANPLPDEVLLVQRSSINVLPEGAALQVSVNGDEAVVLPLENVGEFGALRLPTSALVPGSNRLDLALHQPHRVFCGPEASFGVWTELDLARSGVRLTAAELPADASGFAMAAVSQLGSGQPLRIIADETVDPDLLRQLAVAVGQATRGVGRIEVSSFYAMGPRPAAAVALITSDQNRISYRHGARGGLVLQVEHRPGELPDLSAALQAMVPPGGMAVVPGLQPEQAQTLAALGYADIIGNTHYFRRDLPFSLPADWLLLANQKARLMLSYGFAADLPAGAILLVKINEQTVHLLPLDRNGGTMLPSHPITFAARLLHSGVNQLSFEMMVPGDPPDAACSLRSTDMLVISAETRLEVPGSPRMQMPGLTASLDGLTPAGIKLPLGSDTSPALGQLATRIAAGVPPPTSPNPAVTVTLADLDRLPLMPLDRKALPLTVVQRALWPVSGVDAAGSAVAPGYRLSDGDADMPNDRSGLMDRLYQSVPKIFGSGGWIARQREKLAATAFIGSDQSLSSWLAGRQGVALLMRPDPASPDELWLILGPGAEARTLVQGLTALRASRTAEGEAALLQPDGSWQLWSPVQLPLLREAIKPSNLLQVLGNYASWSPLIFALGLVGAALVSTLPALFVVVHYRRRRLR